MDKYAIHIGPGGATFVKDYEFFVGQGGLVDEWGSHWEVVEALTLEAARVIAIARPGAVPGLFCATCGREIDVCYGSCFVSKMLANGWDASREWDRTIRERGAERESGRFARLETLHTRPITDEDRQRAARICDSVGASLIGTLLKPGGAWRDERVRDVLLMADFGGTVR